MSDVQLQAVVGEDGELFEADQDVDMDVYAEYVEADFPDPTRFQRLLNYISDNIFRSIIVLVIVVFLVIGILMILAGQLHPQTSSLRDLLAPQTQQDTVPTMAPTQDRQSWDRQPLLEIPTPESQIIPIPMPTLPPRDANVTRV